MDECTKNREGLRSTERGYRETGLDRDFLF